jgi:hypothetical protein
MSHLWHLESFLCKLLIEAYLEYESQSEGTKPPPLPKQRKVIIVCLQRTIKDQCLQYLARSQRQQSHFCYSKYPNIVTVNLFVN